MSPELRTSPKSGRAPRQHTRALWEAITAVAAGYDRVTVRQLFYRLVALGVVEKTERAYKRVCDATVQMRLAGALPYHKIADGHRDRRTAACYHSLAGALEAWHEQYRRDYWRHQPVHVEVWCEKDALTGVILPVTLAYGVPYVATRGFPSLTLIYETAMDIVAAGKPATIFYFGDFDPSGLAISDRLEADLRQHGAEVTVRRIALTPEQVQRYRLPTRPSKRSDSRYAGFVEQYGDRSVELDALDPAVLTGLVTESIESMIDPWNWRQAEVIEEQERRTLAGLAGIIGLAGLAGTEEDR